MVKKYVDTDTARSNANVVRKQRTTIFDDGGFTYGTVPGALQAYISAEQYGDVVKRTILTCTNLPISVADDAGQAQYGGAGKIYDFPEGMLLNFGAVIEGTLTMGVTGTFIDAFTGVIGLGTAAASTGATLTSTEADILQSVAMTTAVAKVADTDAQSVSTALTESGARWLDGTATAKDMYLNIAIADDASHTAGTGTFTGVITFLWAMLGDN